MAEYQTIVTAAGDSRPLFLGAGFSGPKSLVMREGLPVLVQAIRSYACRPALTTVAVNCDEAAVWPIPETLEEYFPGIGVELIPGSAKGALISALMAAGNLEPELPLVIAAGDSFIRGGVEQYIPTLHAQGASAGTIVFGSTDARWSYLAINPGGIVTQIAEKQVIGPLATTGVFYFRRSADFLEAAKWCLVNSAHRAGLYFVSTALNHLLVTGHSISFVEIPRHQYVPCALPVDFLEDYDDQPSPD
jgi:hypothetical protein